MSLFIPKGDCLVGRLLPTTISRRFFLGRIHDRILSPIQQLIVFHWPPQDELLRPGQGGSLILKALGRSPSAVAAAAERGSDVRCNFAHSGWPFDSVWRQRRKRSASCHLRFASDFPRSLRWRGCTQSLGSRGWISICCCAPTCYTSPVAARRRTISPRQQLDWPTGLVAICLGCGRVVRAFGKPYFGAIPHGKRWRRGR